MTALYGLPEAVRWCSRCVMSNQRPSSEVEHQHTIATKKRTLHIDEEDVCDACRVAERKASIDWAERERELRDLLDRYRSRNGTFDVIVPGSGGKDSFFAAHVLKHKYKMNPLLVTWAPSIFTDWGWRNLVRWQNLGYHHLFTPNREVNRLLVRLSIENLFHPFACFIYGQKALAPKLAALYGIPLTMFGESESEYGNSIAENGTPKRGSQYHAPTGPIYLAGLSVEELRDKHRLTESDLAPYMPANPATLETKGVDVQYLGYYLRWRPQECYYYAVENGNFEAAPERTPGTYSKYSSLDDKLDDWHYFCTRIKFGIGRATYDAAQEIRSGEITRDEGIALVRRFDGEWPERFCDELLSFVSPVGTSPLDRRGFIELAESFKSPHLWDGDKLRHVVS